MYISFKFKVIVFTILLILLYLTVPKAIDYSKKFIITERNANRCKNGDIEGCNALIKQLPIYPFRDRSINVLKELCQSGNTVICKHVGDIYRDGIVNKSNYPLNTIFQEKNSVLRHAIAKKYYNMACEAANLESCYNILELETLKGDQNLPLHSAVPLLIRENIIFYKKLISQSDYLKENVKIPCHNSFLDEFQSKPDLSTFQSMVRCYHIAKHTIKQALTFEAKDHLGKSFTNYKSQSLPNGKVIKIESLITKLFQQQIEILKSSNIQQHSKAFYTIHKLAHFLIDTFYTSQRPEDIQFLIEKNNFSFLLPIAFNSLSTNFLNWLLKQKDKNGHHLATLVPLKILLLFVDPGSKTGKIFLKKLYSQYFNSLYRFKQMLFLTMLRDFSFFISNTNIIGFSFDQLEKLSLTQDICNGYYLDQTTKPAPSCDKILCQDIKSFETLTNMTTAGSLANIQCLQINSLQNNKNTNSISETSEEITLLNSVLCYQKSYFPKRTLRFLNHFVSNCENPEVLVDSWNADDKKAIFTPYEESSEFYPDKETLTEEEKEKKSKQEQGPTLRFIEKLKNIAIFKKLNISKGVKFLKALKGYKTVKEINDLQDEIEGLDNKTE